MYVIKSNLFPANKCKHHINIPLYYTFSPLSSHRYFALLFVVLIASVLRVSAILRVTSLFYHDINTSNMYFKRVIQMRIST